MLKFSIVLLAAAVSGFPAVFDFETTSGGFYASSLTVSNSGLDLTITPEGFPNGFLYVGDLSVALLGTKSVVGSQVSPLAVDAFSPMRFAFSLPVSSITFAFGDAGGDTDSPVTIDAYSSTNIFLGGLSTSYDAGVSIGGTLGGNFPGASYFIVTSGVGSSNSNSLGWEIVDVQISEVPEPPTMWLLGGSLIGLAVGLRNRRG